MTSTAPRPQPIDLAAEPHLQGVFAPVHDEVDVDLGVVGELPAEMDGLYLRNGPNPRFTPLGSYIFPLDGDGMVHGVWVSEDRRDSSSWFLVIPAADPASGPVARVPLPVRVPLGLHGAWLPTQE